MDPFFNNISHRKINITILATYALVRSSLQSLLENDRRLNVLDAFGTTSEFIEKVSHNKPDVALICLMENEGENINVVSDLVKAASHTKFIILSSPNSLLNHSAALKLGVAGIVQGVVVQITSETFFPARFSSISAGSVKSGNLT